MYAYKFSRDAVFAGNLLSSKIKSSKLLKQSPCIWSTKVDNK